MWDKIQKEKKAGGYPWTHLQHNCNDEVWINPLNLPMDISKETIKRNDGTLPSEWFHLPSGAETPSVDELMRDSPEPELELLETDHEIDKMLSDENMKISTIGRKTPQGRRTPICGKHRNRHKSTGSSPGPSMKSQNLTSPKHHHRTLSQPENLQISSNGDSKNGGYEPVGQMSSSKSVGVFPQGRLPDSELPTLPSDEDSESGDGCFTLRRSRSRSKERKVRKISPRSPSRDSKCSEHPYETPKLLSKNYQKHKATDKSLVDYGYEPIGKPLAEPSTKNLEEETYVEEIVHFTRPIDDKLSKDKTEKQNMNFFTNFLKKISKDENVKEKEITAEIKDDQNKKESTDNEEKEKEAKQQKQRKELEEKQKLERETKRAKEELKRLEAEELKRLKKEKEEDFKKQKKDDEDFKRKQKLESEELKRFKKAEEEERKRKKKDMEAEAKRIKKEEELKIKEEKRLQKEREKLKNEAKKEDQRLKALEKEAQKKREKDTMVKEKNKQEELSSNKMKENLLVCDKNREDLVYASQASSNAK